MSHQQVELPILMMTCAVIASGLTGVMTGCKIGPNYQTPATTMPAKWSEPHNQESALNAVQMTQWWKVFNDQKLNILVERAATSNYDIRIAEARVRQARALRGFYNADLWPSLNASGSYARQRMSKNQPGFGALAAKQGIQLENDVYQAGFDASWEIDVFGGRHRALEAATADLAANVESRNDVLVSLLAEVARNYLELRGLQQRLAIALNNIQLQQDAVNLTQQRLDAGVASELDVTQASALLADTRSQVPALETQIRQSMHRIAVLTGQEPGALVAELDDGEAVPPVPADVPVGLPSELLRRRPDIRRAERQLAAETARIGVQTAELFPKFSLTGNIGLQSISASDFFNGDSAMWSLGPTVRWRIFDAGRIRANIHAQNARQEEALATYEKTILTAMQDVEDALVAYTKEQVRNKAIQDEVMQNQRSVDLADAQYNHGRINFLNVLDAQRSLYQAQDKLAQSRQLMSQNLVALYKALGGGWNPDQDQKKDTSVASH